MIIYHTTFHLSNEVYQEGFNYLRSSYIPDALRSGKLHHPRMMRVLDEDRDVNGVSLSVQFQVADTDVLEEWIQSEGVTLLNAMREAFKDEIVCFSTLLEELYLGG